MQRVLMIGAGGAGKSTFAARLGQRTGLPVIHLDREYWQPGWIEPSRGAWKATVARLVAGERWILDSNFGGSMDLRLQAATPSSSSTCRVSPASGACSCVACHRESARPDMTPGSNEKLSADFLWWMWTYPTRRRLAVLARLQTLRAN